MTVTPTHEADVTLQAIAACQAAGADIVRVAVPRKEDAEALAYIAEHARIPVIADIHFQWKYAVLAIEAGCAAVRINPGNIKKHDKVALLGQLADEAGCRDPHRGQRRAASRTRSSPSTAARPRPRRWSSRP